MASLSVVSAQESVKAPCAKAVGHPGPGVGPFVEQSPIETFCFAVGPGAAGSDESAFELPGRAHPSPVGAAPIDQCVVGEQTPHAHAMAGEPGQRSVQELSAGEVLFVG